ASAMHPTDEHLLPWFIAAGAGGLDEAPVRLHESVEGGHLGMDAYAFGPEAAALAAAVETASTASSSAGGQRHRELDYIQASAASTTGVAPP
ncbi:MAG TPA: hypothetical protein VF453_19615, partial [Burkholderiaceae bacterium]